jgi:RNA-binding protein Musashi
VCVVCYLRSGSGSGEGEGMDSDQGKLFIGGISWETTEEKLRHHFQAYGEVAETVIMKDRATGRARGFGFVIFADPTVADRVVTEKHTIDGRTVREREAPPSLPPPCCLLLLVVLPLRVCLCLSLSSAENRNRNNGEKGYKTKQTNVMHSVLLGYPSVWRERRGGGGEVQEGGGGGRRRAWCGMEQHVITSVAVSLVFFFLDVVVL